MVFTFITPAIGSRQAKFKNNGRRLVYTAADNLLCYMSKRTCGRVLVFPSRRLVLPAADDDFVQNFNIKTFNCIVIYS